MKRGDKIRAGRLLVTRSLSSKQVQNTGMGWKRDIDYYKAVPNEIDHKDILKQIRSKPEEVWAPDDVATMENRDIADPSPLSEDAQNEN